MWIARTFGTSLVLLLSSGTALGLPHNVGSATTYPQTKRSGITYDFPLTHSPFGLLTNTSFGTPAQTFSTFVDLTWVGFHTFTSKCLGKSNNAAECFLPSQKYFHEDQSSTWKNLSAKFAPRVWNPNHFYFDKGLAIEYVSDVVRYGEEEVTTVIQAADFAFKQNFSFPFSVVYGLSPVFKGDNDTIASPFYQNWRDGHFKSPYAAYHWCYGNYSRETCKGADALQTLGYYEPLLADGEIEWYDIINSTTTDVNSVDFVYDPALYNYWALELSRLSLGSTEYALNDTLTPAAVFDHASYGRGAPVSRKLYADLIQRTNATQVTLAEPPNNGPQKTYAFNCAKVASLPPLYYTFKGSKRTWSSPAKHWVVNTTDSDNVDPDKSCLFDVRVVTDLPNGGGDSFDIGNFGETFLKDKYIVLDFDKLRIGLAKLRI